MAHRPGVSAARHGLAAAYLMLLAAGCAAPGGPAEQAERQAAWESHLVWLGALGNWRVAGRVAVSAESGGWSANLRWRQNGERYRVQLEGPFGQGAVRISGDGNAVALRTADGRSARAETPEALATAELGVEVPVSALRYWLTGRPAPGEAPRALRLDWAGRLEVLEQHGWTVRYRDYTQVGSGDLPSRLEVTRGDVEARFLLIDWNVAA
jgi:outer membrane lipoprotein LolB